MAVSNKSLMFFLGLVSGTVIGAGFFVLNLNELLTKRAATSNASIPETTQTTLNDDLNQQETKNIKTSATETMNTANRQSTGYDTPLVNILKESDSLLRHSPVFNTQSNETIVVRKDQLLSAKVIQIESTEKNETVASDSILEKISGIKNTEHASSFRRTEFWTSPINYKGYKQTQNKLVLFGINPDLELKLYNRNGRIFMKYDAFVYELYFTEEFKQFEKTTDPTLIESLK